MRHFRSALLAAGAVVVAAAASAAPAVADTRLVVAHGLPGVKVDVCVGDVKVGGGLRYGKSFKTSLPAGTYELTVRRASEGACRGAVVIKQNVTFDGTEDLSIVAAPVKGEPSLLVFDNSTAHDEKTALSIKHAAGIGRADVYVSVFINVDIVARPAPTASGVAKGDQLDLGIAPADAKIELAKTKDPNTILAAPYMPVREGKVNHVVFVGKKDNLRAIKYRTSIPTPG